MAKQPIDMNAAALEFSKSLSELDKLKSDETILSKESGNASYETLFNSFDLTACPVYNFYVEDELFNDQQGVGKRKLEEIPRYIVVSWERPKQIKQDDVRPDPSSITSKKIGGVLFGSEIMRKRTFDLGGISFSPKHLQPDSFAIIKTSLANDAVSPGTLRTTLELDTIHMQGATGYSQGDAASSIDEQMFLSDPSLAGISIQEVKAHIYEQALGTRSTRAVESTAKSESSDFVSGKFSFSNSQNGTSIKSVHPSSPAISLESLTSGKGPGQVDAAQKIGDATSPSRIDESTITTKANFVNPNIGGAISKSRLDLATRPEHAENAIALSQILSQLDILSKTDFYDKKPMEMPAFRSPGGIPGLEYVGYVLEKYCQNQYGVFSKVEEIDLENRDYDTYIDSKVRYGSVYRYRIKSIVRWTRDTASSPKKHIVKLESSYFSSEWNEKWAYATCIDQRPPAWPDELTVRPESHKKRVCVTFKVPDNSQRDLDGMVLYRKVQDSRRNDLNAWTPVLELRGTRLNPQNGMFIDRDVDHMQKNGLTYVYAARSFSCHGEASDLSEQIACQLTADYSTYGEIPAFQVSCGGVPFSSFGAFSVSPPKRTSVSAIVDKSLSISGREAFTRGSLSDSDYVVRIESLDSGESLDVPVSMGYNNLPTEERTINSNFWVPSTIFQNALPTESVKPNSKMLEDPVPVKIQKGVISKGK